MPALTFGLGAAKPSGTGNKGKPALKRKAVFTDAGSDDDGDSEQAPPQAGAKKSSRPLKPLQPLAADEDSDCDDSPRPTKSPKLSHPAPPSYGLQKKTPAADGTSKDKNGDRDSSSDKYTNLSALRSAKLHDAQASKLDASVYDYDGVYDTFRPATDTKSKGSDAASSGPKYMSTLLASTEQRKRDHERAREKAIQRERENEGDEFKDKEAFVTSAYKAQQVEMRKAEEDEAKRLEEEEEKRRRGAGMMDFNKRMLEREEERMKAIAEAEERKKNAAGDEGVEGRDMAKGDDEDGDVDRKAKDLNEHGARIAVNEEGEVIDKRQLLTAGLNVAPKKPGAAKKAEPSQARSAERPQGARAGGAQDGRQAQRERQSRMVERQMEQMMEKQREAEEAEQREQQEKNKSKISDDAKMSAKERYLARKREREEEAAAAKKGDAAAAG